MFRLVISTALKFPKAPNVIASNARILWITQRSQFAVNAKLNNEAPHTLKDLINRLKMNIAENKPTLSEHLDAISNQLDIENANSNQSLILLQSFRDLIENENQRDRILSILIKLKLNKKCSFNKAHFVCAIQCYQIIGDVDGAEETLKEMRTARIKIPPVAYQMMLQLYCRAGNTEKVTEWIGRIADAKLHLNQGSYNHLTQCYLKCGDLEMANHTMEIIKLNNFTIHIHTLNEFVKYFARHGDIENVIKTLDSFEESNLNKRNKCVIDAIYELATNGHMEQIDSLLGHLDADYISLSFVNTTITRFVENGQPHVLPKFLGLIAKNLKENLYFFVQELQRMNTPPDQFDKITDELKLAGIDVSLKKRPNSERALDNKNAKQLVAISYNSLDTDQLRFQKFVREKNMAEVEKIVQKGTLQMNQSKSSILIEMYADIKNLDKAMETLKKIRATRKSYRLDYVKVAKLVKLLIEQDRDVEEIIELIKTNRQDEAKQHVPLYEEIFESLAEAGNDTLLNQIYKPLIDSNHVEKSSLTKYLVLIHIKKGDFKQAVDAYENVQDKTNLVQLALQLLCELIDRHETDLLQRVYKALETARGESFAQYGLAMALVKCGLVDKAKQIFDSGKIHNLAEKLLSEIKVCGRYGNIEEAKHLLDATTEKHCDRRQLYKSILDIYFKKGQINEAIRLWNDHENDSVKPNEEFLNIFKKFLNKHSRPIPLKILTHLKLKPATE